MKSIACGFTSELSMEPSPGPAELDKYSFDLAVEIWPLALKDIH